MARTISPICAAPGESVSDSETQLTHVDEAGAVRMVDVGQKPVSQRRAVAVGHVVLQPRPIELLRAGELQKVGALAVARVARVAAAKRTPGLVPRCTPIAITAE